MLDELCPDLDEDLLGVPCEEEEDVLCEDLLEWDERLDLCGEACLEVFSDDDDLSDLLPCSVLLL